MTSLGALAILACLSTANSYVVHTSLGSIQGNILETWKGSRFRAFRGIPFAEPPVGTLRFKDPQPIKPWSDVFNATVDGPICPQPLKRWEIMSEDCLRLNVYTRDTLKPLKPVLLFIPGGGLYVGSGVSTEYGGPSYMMEHDIVLVTINYRLGTLGFLSLGIPEYPGNAGFKDQVLALRWVRDHIRHFGGDPDRVTLIGHSAGAISIGLHLISPMSKGLFHQAIIGSGGLLLNKPLPRDQKDVARKQAELFQCQKEVLQCLQEASMEAFVNSTFDMFVLGFDSPWSYGIVEPDFGQERFLVEDLVVSMEAGRFQKMPIVIGTTAKEFMDSAYGVTSDEQRAQQFSAAYEVVYPQVFFYEGGTADSRRISRSIRDFYGLDKTLNANDTDVLCDMISDGTLGFGSHRLAKFMAPFEDVYAYRFSYTERYSHFYDPKTGKPYAAVHSDDFIYLMVREPYAPIFKPTDPEAPFIEKFTKLYANFVASGRPNSGSWRTFHGASNEYYDIDRVMKMTAVSELERSRMELWESLFPVKYPTSGCRASQASTLALFSVLISVICILVQ